jgi:uncharacterized protein YciU (UPF0263 family)
MNNHSDWLNRTDYTAEERLKTCCELMMEAQYWDVHQYLKMMHDSTKRKFVGLTDEELSQFDVDPIEAKLMIAKLKEKNT